MNTVKITEENVGEYIDFLDDDSSQYIGRKYFRGLALHENANEPPKALVVWEYKNTKNTSETVAKIWRFYCQSPEYAKEMLDEYSGEVRAFGAKRSVCEFSKTNEGLKSQLEENGFAMSERENKNIEVTIGELEAVPFFSVKTVPDYISDISELMVFKFEEGIASCIASGRTGVLEDLEYLPIDWFDEDVSCCSRTNGKVMGFFLVHRSYSGKLYIDLFYAAGEDAMSKLVDMTRLSWSYAIRKYPKETIVVLPRHNSHAAGLIDKLFADKKGELMYFGERKE